MCTFFTTLDIVLPIFLLIVLGFLLRQIGILDETGCGRMNTFAF